MPSTPKYKITQNHLTPKTKRRPGLLLDPGVRFIVAHDTGNPGATAQNHADYFESTCEDYQVSAHIFVDDKDIIECIPATTPGKAEKAWHVLYRASKDNELYGRDANDAAIGVEYCYGGRIDPGQAYKRYVWTLAHLCRVHRLDPKKDIAGHFQLDPKRKIDPMSGLKTNRKSFGQLVEDVVKEYEKQSKL